MGMSYGGVFIQLDSPNDYTHENIAQFFFDNILSIDSQLSTENRFDLRNPNNVIITFYDNAISIANSQFTDKILISRDKNIIEKIYSYFDYPDTILAVMNYDSGGSYGFCYIRGGKIKRVRYALHDWGTYYWGDPLDEELPILNAKITFIEDEDGEDDDFGEIVKYSQYEKDGFFYSYSFIDAHLTSAVMKAKFGFDLHDYNVDYIAKFIILST